MMDNIIRGKEKLSMQVLLVFAAMNLKKDDLMVMEEGQRAL